MRYVPSMSAALGVRCLLAGAVAVSGMTGCQHSGGHRARFGTMFSEPHAVAPEQVVPEEGTMSPTPIPPGELGPALQPPMLPDGPGAAAYPPPVPPVEDADAPVAEPVEASRKIMPKSAKAEKGSQRPLRARVAAVFGTSSKGKGNSSPLPKSLPGEATVASTTRVEQPVQLASPPEIFEFDDFDTPLPTRTVSRRVIADETDEDDELWDSSVPGTGEAEELPPEIREPAGALDLTPVSDARPAKPAFGGHTAPRLAKDVSQTAGERLTVGRVAVCHEIRGFNDITELNPRELRRGQAILVYAALENSVGQFTDRGYCTETVSELELWSADGTLVARLPLGKAVDVAEQRRGDFFLTHHLRLPSNLRGGEYTARLRIEDLTSGQSTSADLVIVLQ